MAPLLAALPPLLRSHDKAVRADAFAMLYYCTEDGRYTVQEFGTVHLCPEIRGHAQGVDSELVMTAAATHSLSDDLDDDQWTPAAYHT